MSLGFSIIVCCYNSEQRISDTLVYLNELRPIDNFPVEIIIVDNNSSDNTIKKVITFNKDNESRYPIKIVKEEKQGLTNARLKGINEGQFDYLIFCDDDNWLFPDYLEIVLTNLKNKDCLAVGGVGIPKSDVDFPNWFNEFEGFGYAVGFQNRKIGFGQFVYGAGMAIKKKAAIFYSKRRHLLVDRVGTTLSSGGDTEICYIIKLQNIFFDDRLKFYHFIPKHRLTWDYYKKLNGSFGLAQSLLFYYRLAEMSKPKALRIIISKIYHNMNFILFNIFKRKDKRIDIEFEFKFNFIKGSLSNLPKFSELYFHAKKNSELIDT